MHGFGGFQPYQSQTPIIQPMPINTQPQTNVQWIYVNGLDGARSQIVEPGRTAWMMDNNDPVLYVKAVDGMGSATLKAFRLEEIPDSPKPERTDIYATKDDLKAISDKLDQLIGGYSGV